MFRIVYISAASRYFAQPEIQAMLERARFKNSKIGITGMLLYKDGNFLQALEGEEEVVTKLAETIQNDPRHTGFVVLMRGTVERRLFPESPMGFHDLAAEPLTSTPSDTDFIDSPLTRATFSLDPNRCMKLLSHFSSQP